MKALVFEEFGAPNVLKWTEVSDPQLTIGGAIVQIAAAGLNFADVYRRRGNYHMDSTPPWILGYEGAGTVVKVSEELHDNSIKLGSRVCFADAPRANAEFVAVPLEKLILLPDYISFETAAAVILQGLTAQYLCSDSYAVRSGDVAVVHAAAGGVGLLLTQMLKARGAKVIALASTVRKQIAARHAGADFTLSYDEAWANQVLNIIPKGADVVYDSVGTTLLESMRATRISGTLVFYGFAGGTPPSIDPRVLMDRSLTVTGGDLWNILTTADERRQRANLLFQSIKAGNLIMNIAECIPMKAGEEAHRLLESRSVIGKIVLAV